MNRLTAFCVLLGLSAPGCYHGNVRPSYDRPFPLGAVTDVFWKTQQTNAEATDFILYDHEFKGNTAQLAPLARRHLEEIAADPRAGAGGGSVGRLPQRRARDPAPQGSPGRAPTDPHYQRLSAVGHRPRRT